MRTVLVKNPNWWGLKDQPIDIDEIVFSRIANAATRAAALLSGELDMIYNVPLQDIERIRGTPGMKIWQTPELGAGGRRGAKSDQAAARLRFSPALSARQ